MIDDHGLYRACDFNVTHTDRLARAHGSLMDRLPDHLELSIEGLDAGSRVTAADVVLPEGVELSAEAEMVIAVISGAPSAAEMAEEVGQAPEGEAAEAAPAEA